MFIFIYKKYLYQGIKKKETISIIGPNLVFVLTLTLLLILSNATGML